MVRIAYTLRFPATAHACRYLQFLYNRTLDTCNVTGYNQKNMIQNFKNKVLKQLFEKGTKSGVNSQHVKRLKMILALLETAETLEDMDLPGLNLHELKGKRKGTWSLKVSGNWRVTFRLEKGDALDVNYENYH